MTDLEQRAAVRALLAQHEGEAGALLPILHDVQDRLGCVPAHVVPEIAGALNLSRAEVHGVVTYYHHFRSEPAARHVVQICRAEACQAMGAEALLAHARRHLGCDAHGTSKDGNVTLEPAYCLGLCASSPSMMVDDEPHARVTPRTFDAIVAPLMLSAPITLAAPVTPSAPLVAAFGSTSANRAGSAA